MYALLSRILADHKGGAVFSCFGIWHFCYLIAVVILAAAAIVYLRKKSRDVRQKALSLCIGCAFCIYIADFFLMPFAYGEIDIEKLPFHVCTAMCVMCFCSRHSRRLGKYRQQFALLGFLSNLVYLIYPAGVMWYQIHPLSYRVIQTLLFHGTMAIYGLLALLFDDAEFSFKRCYRDLLTLVGMTLWAILGNALYTGEAWGRSNGFNWFFVTRDPFNMFPAQIAPFVMPVLNVTLFFGVEMLVYALFAVGKKSHRSANDAVDGIGD